MFELIPAVDIQRGRAVRLFEGKSERETVYFESPVEAAQHWADQGASWLHLVDLDAAFGNGDNHEIIREIANTTKCKVEVGGGIRDAQTARKWLEIADRIIIGTAAINQPEMLDELVAEYEEGRVAVSIDAKNGQVAVKGWTEITELAARELARRVAQQGIKHVIYTDISRDGTMKGIDPEPVSLMRQAYPHTLVAGGGVAGDKDLELYESLELNGAIVGTALYEGKISYPRT